MTEPYENDAQPVNDESGFPQAGLLGNVASLSDVWIKWNKVQG